MNICLQEVAQEAENNPMMPGTTGLQTQQDRERVKVISHKMLQKSFRWQAPEMDVPTASLVNNALTQFLGRQGYEVTASSGNDLVMVSPEWKRVKGSVILGLLSPSRARRAEKLVMNIADLESSTQVTMSMELGGGKTLKNSDAKDHFLEEVFSPCIAFIRDQIEQAKISKGRGVKSIARTIPTLDTPSVTDPIVMEKNDDGATQNQHKMRSEIAAVKKMLAQPG